MRERASVHEPLVNDLDALFESVVALDRHAG
jgi:hypothetical protein